MWRTACICGLCEGLGACLLGVMYWEFPENRGTLIKHPKQLDPYYKDVKIRYPVFSETPVWL